MGRRRRYDPDPVLHTYIENYRRAGVALLLAVGLLLAWALCAFVVPRGAHAQVPQIVPGIFVAFFGWAGVITLVGAALLYAYAFYYPNLMARIDR